MQTEAGAARRRARWSSSLLAFVAIALATTVCGCGSSSKPLTHAQLKTRADSICQTVTAQLSNKKISSVRDLAKLAPELASFEQAALAKLSKLVPPVALEADWKRFVAGAQTLAENTSKLGEYVKTNDLKAARALIVSSERLQQQMQTIAKRIGLASCEQVA